MGNSITDWLYKKAGSVLPQPTPSTETIQLTESVVNINNQFREPSKFSQLNIVKDVREPDSGNWRLYRFFEKNKQIIAYNKDIVKTYSNNYIYGI